MTTFGPFFAFIRLWIECMIVRPCSQAIVALTFSVCKFLIRFSHFSLFKHFHSADVMKPFFPDCQPPGDSARLLAVCCICKYFLERLMHGTYPFLFSGFNIHQLLLCEVGIFRSRYFYVCKALGFVHYHRVRFLSFISR